MRAMNLPNRLTILRVLVIPFFVAALLTGYSIVALVLFCAASITDWLDGFIARKYDMVTNFGKFMDPLADKLLVCAALICFTQMGLLPAWMVLIIISREFIISGFRLLASDQGVVIAASYWGKFKTTFQMIMVILLILHINHPVFQVLEFIFIWGALILTVVSLIDYLVKNRGVLTDQQRDQSGEQSRDL